jgi:imidazolonepropionase
MLPLTAHRSLLTAFMRVIANIGQLATCRADGGQGDIHAVASAAMAWDDQGTLQWVGRERDLPAEYRSAERLDAQVRLVIPGLVDCHTHLAFAGWRASEFEQRIEGRSYLEIARAGGGIMATVEATRRATEEDLVRRAKDFLAEMLSLGITTVECKTGYGLNEATELKLLRVYRRLAEAQPVRLVPTFLGAHVVPPEYRENRSGYVALLIDRLIPRIAKEQLAVCCDVFVEETAFSLDEARRILQAGRQAGLAP